MAENPPAAQGRFKKILGRTALGLLLVFSILSVGVSVWRIRASGKAQAKLAAIAESGLPTLREEVRPYYESLQTGPDITGEWRETLVLLEDDQFKADHRDVMDGAGLFLDTNTYFSSNASTADPVQLTAFVAKYANLIDQLHATANKEGHIDLLDLEEVTYSPEINKLPTVAELLAADAVVDVHHGNIEGFIESAEAILQVGHLLDNEMLMVGQLVRLRILRLGVDTIHHSLGRIQLPADSSSRLVTQLGELDHLPSFQRGMVGARAIMTSCFSDLNRWDYADKLTRWGRMQAKLGASSDLCHYLDYMQSVIDLCGQPLSEAWRGDPTTLDDLASMWPRPVITLTVAPEAAAIVEMLRRSALAANACRVGVAVEAFRNEHGQIPDKLDDLVPEFLESVPSDPYVGEPLRFQRWEGGYRVYSVGPDREDDGGLSQYMEGYLFPMPNYGPQPGTPDWYQPSADDSGFEVPTAMKLIDTARGEHPPRGYSGPWQVLWPSGQPRYNLIYRDGQRHGRCTTFSDSVPKESISSGGSMGFGGPRTSMDSYGESTERRGPVLAEGIYKNDKPHDGTFCHWNGTEPTILRYEDGKQMSE